MTEIMTVQTRRTNDTAKQVSSSHRISTWLDILGLYLKLDSRNDVAHSNIVALHRARLVLGWTTNHGYRVLLINSVFYSLLQDKNSNGQATVVVLCSWKGNRGSLILPAMACRLCIFTT